MIYVTDLTEYLFCPYKLYLKRIRGLPLPQTSEMLIGTVIHRIYEEVFLRERVTIEQRIEERMGIDEIFKILYADSKRVIKNVMIKNRENLKDAGVDYLDLIKELQEELKEDQLLKSIRIKKYMGVYGKEPDLYKNLFMIQDMEYPVSSKELDLSGKIDKIEEDSEGNIYPIELKTGIFSKGIRKHEKLQISAYALLLEKERGISVPLGFLEYYQVKQRIPFLIKKEDREEVLKILGEVKKLFESDIKPLKEKKSYCKRCGYNDFCWQS